MAINYTCDFCGRGSDEVRKMFTDAERDAAICSECVLEAVEVLMDTPMLRAAPTPTPTPSQAEAARG